MQRTPARIRVWRADCRNTAEARHAQVLPRGQKEHPVVESLCASRWELIGMRTGCRGNDTLMHCFWLNVSSGRSRAKDAGGASAQGEHRHGRHGQKDAGELGADATVELVCCVSWSCLLALSQRCLLKLMLPNSNSDNYRILTCSGHQGRYPNQAHWPTSFRRRRTKKRIGLVRPILFRDRILRLLAGLAGLTGTLT